MAVNCSWVTSAITEDHILVQQLPLQIRERLLKSSGSEFLEALAEVSLLPRCTDRIFVHFQHLISELTARWCTQRSEITLSEEVNIVSSLARILPFTPHLRPRTKIFLFHSRIWSITTQFLPLPSDLDDETLLILLLAIFRLLSYSTRHFGEVVAPLFLSSLLKHSSLPVRYLAIQCFCKVMRFADAFAENLVQQHIHDETIKGDWEGREIDYRVVKLLEEQRWQALQADLVLESNTGDEESKIQPHLISETDLNVHTASIGGILVSREDKPSSQNSSFVMTPTAIKNMRRFGQAILKDAPILLTGPASSGKTNLILEAARLLNKSSSTITLHLNEQTDAKSLLGVYTSSTTGDSFVWQPGVLTKAVEQGRWVLIEDIDRAPAEVLGVLRPVIENGELFLPSRKEFIRPKDGFRIIATIKTSGTQNKAVANRHAWLSNNRLWSVVAVDELQSDETETVLKSRYPAIEPLASNIIMAHEAIVSAYRNDKDFRAAQGRLPSIRDLLKWCRRINLRISIDGLALTDGPMPESLKLDIFQDAVDCYVIHHSDDDVYYKAASVLARAFNIAPQQMEHCLGSSALLVSETKLHIKIGRSTLIKLDQRQKSPKSRSFAFTDQARKTIDSIAAGANFSEPLLLVGETGVGKTTLVQHIASLINQKLTVINLSQQSEVSDLLGGLKPITTRSLLIPLVDQFNTLFDDTFSSKRNEKFQVAISKAVQKQNWLRLLHLWQDAIILARNTLSSAATSITVAEGEQVKKKRKLATPKYQMLQDRWMQFSLSLEQIQAQVSRGQKNHTFAFVEGRLVQAVRNGEWLLLDEINLASADTLDHIISLLHNRDDEMPSLLLTEAGTVEQVVAHANFKIFAAMNPATDTGKKDLAPGVRSRFTEIYVQPGDNETGDLVKIIDVYLGSALSSDKRAALDLANAYLVLKKLNDDHKLTDGAGDVPHFSIRSLVRCLLYVKQHGPSHGLRRAMMEGFAMSFFTVLSRESESLAAPSVNTHLLSNVRNPKTFVTQQPKIPFDGNDYVAFRHHLVLKGAISPDLQPQYIRTPSVERNLLNLARATSMRRFPILLQGPTSAGKTSMVEYLAKLSGNNFVRINNHEHTDLQEYLGNYASGSDGKLEYREGVLVEALRKGDWIVLDELNLAPSDVLEALNRLLDDNRELLIPESQEIVRPHPNFMLFATQNPAGLYGGRKRLSRAFRNRFLELHFDDIPEDELEIILRERSQIPPSFCKQIVEVYQRLSLQRQSTRLFEQRNSFATLRDLFRWAARPVDDRQQLAFHGFMLLAERVRDPTEREIVRSTIEETLRVKIDENMLYGPQVIDSVPLTSSSVVWTPAMRRLFVLVSAALRSNEPILLVGETGCGKTQICQTVATVFGKELSIYNAHSNTETGDLIGSQRPIRQRSELQTTLLDDLHVLSPDSFPRDSINNQDINELVKTFKNMDVSSIDPLLIEKAKSSIAAYQSLFIWSDGNLVRSMKAGEHFLLDEISLADDSVLERLNSVLEPSRTILLAEKGSKDNLVIAEPGFQFLATMNPGGDYGKRELSAALRNRLTEIWVPPLSKDGDIIPILGSKLGPGRGKLAIAMLEFAKWFKQNLQNSPSATIPLRSLLVWAEFITKMKTMSSDMAFVHGAAMVYIDSLGANPAGMTSSAGDLHDSRTNCLEKLQQLIDVNVFEIYNAIPFFEVTVQAFQLGGFSLSRTSEVTDLTEVVFDAPTTMKNTMRLVRALQMDRPILLEGSPGVGKTAIITALAQAVGKTLTRINLSDQTDLMDLFGADAPSEDEQIGRFSWRDGPLLQSMQLGGWVLLDEMNLASQSVLEGLNSCLDHRHEVYIAELDKTFTCHPDFMLFAAQNPHHQGGGRKGLPASFVNRFTVVYADSFQEEDLQHICRTRRPSMDQNQLATIIKVMTNTERLMSHSPSFGLGGPWELNLRDVNRWFDLCETMPAVNPAQHFGSIVTQRFRTPGARQQAWKICKQFFGPIEEQSLYHNLSSHVFQLGTAFLPRDNFLQHVKSSGFFSTCQLPYAKSVITAVNKRWPVILAGPSGCGKTFLIRNLAALNGSKLVELAMNSDVDTMDLLGGFEQYDMKRDVSAIKNELQDLLARFITQSFDGAQLALRNAQQLLAMYEQCTAVNVDVQMLAHVAKEVSKMSPIFDSVSKHASKVLRLSANAKSRFVWNDGILINALVDGSWLVLDNANLCNPSVLDRLNSLLEPNGYLTITEQHSAEDRARIIVPHSNFRVILTMDPRYGELSRAMRNRSLEIFMEVDESSSNFAPNTLPVGVSDARLYRIRPLVSAMLSGQVQGDANVVGETRIEFLSLADIRLMQQPHLELKNKTVSYQLDTQLRLPLWFLEAFANTADYTYSDTTGIPQPVLAGLKLTDQPFLPLMNEPVFDVSTDKSILWKSERIWRLFESFSISQSLREMIVAAKGTINGNVVHTGLETVLARSLINSRQGKRSDLILIGKVVQVIWESLSSALQAAFKSCDLAIVEGLGIYILLVRDLLLILDMPKVDHAVLQAYMTIMEQTLNNIKNIAPSLGDELIAVSTQVSSNYSLRSGRSLQRMWQVWKPETAQSLLHIKTEETLELLLQTFDGLVQLLSISRKQLSLLRVKLLQIYLQNLSANVEQQDINNLQDAIKGLQLQVMRKTPIKPHFSATFDQLLCLITLQKGQMVDEDFQLYGLFSNKRSTQLNLTRRSKSITDSLRCLAYVNENSGSDVSVPMNVDGKTLVSQLSNVEDQSLDEFEHAREELGVLSHALAVRAADLDANPVKPLIMHASVLLYHIFATHSDWLTTDARSLLDSEKVLELTEMDIEHVIKQDIEDAQYFKDIMTSHVTPMVPFLNAESSMIHAGLTLVNISIAALKLLVPDKMFDPAVYPALISDRHASRAAVLQAKITSRRDFQRHFTGQDTSLVIRLLQKDLVDVGPAPMSPKVVRPTVSELDTIHAEFLNVLRNIIETEIEKQLVDSVLDEEERVNFIQDLQTRLRTLAARLNCINRCYDDIVKPVIWLLESLSLGLKFVAADNKAKRSNIEASILARTPLLGARPAAVTGWRNIDAISISSLDLVSDHWLKCAAMCASIEKRDTDLDVSHFDNFISLLDQHYLRWKSMLGKDQADAAFKSKYYAYRGGDEAEIEEDEKEFANMFRTFDDEDQTVQEEVKVSGQSFDARNTAIKLAQFHYDLMFPQNKQFALRSCIKNALSIYGQNEHNQLASLGVLRHLLPGVFLQLKEANEKFAATDTLSQLNIYTDSSIKETRTLVDLVTKIQIRFTEISERWPEHAVPLEVLAYCDQLLAFKLNDPIARLLTKTEKLFEIVSQWQSIASREWSVVNQVESLTALIIHWRRLELSSWSRLLEIEKANQERNAAAWYFIAYEAVIYNSRLVVEQRVDVSGYCLELAGTLEEFMKATTLGQYKSRLRLLDLFLKTLNSLAVADARLLPICQTMSTVLYHYARYEDSVQQTLDTGRLNIEKALVEQIKLASWKDTNVTSLRDSAKKTHHKLFRVVKKYRSLLAQPITSFKANESEYDRSQAKMELELSLSEASTTKLHLATSLCASELTDWSLRPERLVNPLGAIATMRHFYKNHYFDHDVPGELESFQIELSKSIKDLRQETPKIATKDNGSIIRDLKQRKKRLLANTVRDVTQMGIRRNLGTAELGKQSSSAIVLANSPDVLSFCEKNLAKASNASFHAMLDLMSDVRSALIEHSEELTEGQTRRCVGMLEGMLSILLEQRQNLHKSHGVLSQLAKSMASIENLQQIAFGKLSKSSKGLFPKLDWIKNRLAWLPEMLDLSRTIIAFQSQQGGFDMGTILDIMSQWSEHLRSYATQISDLSAIPDGVVNSTKLEVLDSVAVLINDISTQLQQWQSFEPRIDHVLRQLIPWTLHDGVFTGYTNGVFVSTLPEFDASCRQLLDQVFVALQQKLPILSTAPRSSEDPGWLVKTDKVLLECFRSLNLSQICGSLQNVLSRLHCLPSDALQVGDSLLVVANPILQQFHLICQDLYNRQMQLHFETCQLGGLLTRVFISIMKQGFCSPPEHSDGEEQSGKVESGTGLGEGEGAEDISKDIEDDEDLTELAQGADAEEKDDQEMDKSKDAVDMGVDDLEGEMGSGDEKGSEEEGEGKDSEDEAGSEMDEETGSVDDLDPSAVDEKMWDDMDKETKEEEKEMKADKTKGKQTDDQTNRQDGNEGEDEEDNEMQDELDDGESEADDDAGKGRPEAENVDPHLQEEEKLDLPEEMQLNGEEDGKDDDISDTGMDDLSDVEGPDETDIKREEVDGVSEPDEEEQKSLEDDLDENAGEEEADVEDGEAMDNDINEDEMGEDPQEEEETTFDARDDEMQHDVDEIEAGDTGTANQNKDGVDAEQDENAPQGQKDPENAVQQDQAKAGNPNENEDKGDAASGAVEKGVGQEDLNPQRQDEALKKLADVLDQFHQCREILTSNEERAQDHIDDDVDMTDADFEHVQDEQDSDAQALGAATADQAQNLDRNRAIEDQDAGADEDLPMPVDNEQAQEEQIRETIAERFSRLQTQARTPRDGDSGLLASRHDQERIRPEDLADMEIEEEDENLDTMTQEIIPQNSAQTPPTSQSDAAQLWEYCSTRSHSLSLILTEQLRLILAPTTATKLRGDFRTGKRLNIKRIIPYIASGYKRDKIWMRRSIPSKRNYQIMIAVDDSKSMSESGADLLAFETVVMLCKSLSMLEAGEICVVGFGDEPHIRVAHPFGQPFTAMESGVQVIRTFGFNQQGTDVRKLIKQSIDIFRDARLRSTQSSADLWQLQLIVSDGHCSDHEAVRRLVRQAKEEKIMIVFVIVDAGQDSIIDLKEAVFEKKDPSDESSPMEVKTRRYLEKFPFQYYVVVREVADLPGVLARVLKGWFESLVDG